MAKCRDGEADMRALIGQAYDAALDDTLWPGLAPRIARSFDSISTAVQMRNVAGDVRLLAITDNLAPDLMAEYRDYYWRHDVWANRATQLGMSRPYMSKDLVSDAFLERSEYYADWLRKLGLFYVVGSIFPVNNAEICVIGAHRARAHGTYDENMRKRMGDFLPHLRRALQLRHKLSHVSLEKSTALEALERTGDPVLVAARDARLLYANAGGEALLAEGDAICVVGGRLAVADKAAGARLAFLISSAIDTAAGANGSAGSAIALARDDRLPLTILVAPFRPARDGFGAPLPAAILFIRDPERGGVSQLFLQDMFALAPAESTIAAALAEGNSVEYITRTYRITLNTARTHLKRIFAKTNTRRQGELVALLTRSVAALTPK
jgi:DNA-binding CsgD family transcriptional regulator